MQPTVIGLDIGHSTVKIAAASSAGRHAMIFPSVAIPAFAISDEAEAHRALRETVTVQQRSWFIGDTALAQSCGTPPALGLTNDWITTPEHSALAAGAAKRLAALGVDLRECLVVTGLPSSLHTHQKNLMREIIRRHFPGKVMVAPQPMGPFQGLMLNPDGSGAPDRNIQSESWAVVDVGYYTTDFLLMQSGRWIEKASGSCGGIRLAAEHMQRLLHQNHIQVDPFEAEQALRERKIKNFGKTLDVSQFSQEATALICSEIVDTATRLIASVARKLDGILLAGGGASVVLEDLQTKWPHAQLAPSPRMAVAEGFCRFGLSFLNKTARTDEAAHA